MAVRFRKDIRKLPWQTYWNNPFTGKREGASFATELEAKKHDSLIKHRLKFERESFFKEEEQEQENEAGLTLEQVFCAYVNQKKPRRNTFKSQLVGMRHLISLFKGKPVADITREDIQASLKVTMTQKGIKNVTVRNYYGTLRTLLFWAAEQGLCKKIDFPRLPQNDCEHFIPPTPDEIALIMEHAAPHIRRVCVIGSQFGVRVGPSELCKLTWEDVDLHRQVLRVHSAAKNKSCPWREIPIRDSLVPIFEQWHREDKDAHLPDDCPLIHFGGKPVGRMQTAWNATLERAGITRRIRLYDLRHAFATEAIAGGADIGTVAKLMGHANPTMILKHYQYVTDRQKLAAVEALPEPQYVPKHMCQKNRQSKSL